MHRRTSLLAVAGLFFALACSKTEPAPAPGASAAPAAGGDVALTGAGATFPYPLYSKWMSEYNKQNPHVQINYQSIGSGGGIRQITAGTVDFGATDAPMSAEEASKAPRPLHHIPTTIGAVAITFNVAGVTSLKVAQDVLADIYLGKVTKWNDARITATNEGVKLPDSEIKVVYRSDGSGTTGVFTEYLAKVSPAWKDGPGVGKSVKWPVGLGAKGNEGVSGQVKSTPGSLGYVELAYAKQNSMTTVSLRNKAGNFIAPDPKASTAAANGVELPESLTASISDSAAPDAYPLAAYTYLLVYQDSADVAKATALARFLTWALTDGQKFATELEYAPLPAAVVEKAKARVAGLTAGGAKLTP